MAGGILRRMPAGLLLKRIAHPNNPLQPPDLQDRRQPKQPAVFVYPTRQNAMNPRFKYIKMKAMKGQF
jgi:hypothetical protein